MLTHNIFLCFKQFYHLFLYMIHILPFSYCGNLVKHIVVLLIRIAFHIQLGYNNNISFDKDQEEDFYDKNARYCR